MLQNSNHRILWLYCGHKKECVFAILVDVEEGLQDDHYALTMISEEKGQEGADGEKWTISVIARSAAT